jgi:3-oxoacyl-[acyl-carrier protein] reductase
MELGLEGKVAIVTGGSEGIGSSTAAALAREGARVCIVARRADVLERTVARIGHGALAVAGDVTALADLERVVATVASELGPPTILVNNAGSSAARSFDSVSDEGWQVDLELKLHAAIRLTRLTLPYMRAARDGRIVNVTALAGKTPLANTMPTSVSRAAGIAFTKALSKDLAADGVRVNTVCIGLVKSTQIAARAQREHPGLDLDASYALMGSRIPMGRVGETAEAANVITFLLSDAASYVTGSSINIDGGSSAVV